MPESPKCLKYQLLVLYILMRCTSKIKYLCDKNVCPATWKISDGSRSRETGSHFLICSSPPVQPQSWATGAPRPRGGGQLDDNQARPKKDLPLSKRKRVKCPLFNATEVLHINLPPLMAFFYHLQICKKNSQLLRKEILLSLSCISNHNFLPFLQTNT